MKKQRKHYTPEEKVAILRRHLVERVPISDLCDELGLQPTVFSAEESPPAGRVTDETDYFRLADNSRPDSQLCGTLAAKLRCSSPPLVLPLSRFPSHIMDRQSGG